MTRIALIGTGKWGINYLNTIEKMNNCKITHIVSLSSKSLSRFSNLYHKTTNYLDLLSESEIDGVIIASPGSTHYKIVNDLINKYPLLVEKPLTLSLKNALQINKNGNQLMVGHVYLYN